MSIKNKNPYTPLSGKIIALFLILSITILMSGFVVQAQLLGQEAKFWRTAATYYYLENQENNENIATDIKPVEIDIVTEVTDGETATADKAVEVDFVTEVVSE